MSTMTTGVRGAAAPTVPARGGAGERGAGAIRGALALGLGWLLAALLAGCSAPSPETLLGDARKLTEKRDYAAAEVQLKNVLQQQPENGEARFLLGRVYSERQQYLAAEKELRHAQSAGYDPNRVAPLLVHALFETGQYDRAVGEVAASAVPDAAARARVEAWRSRAFGAMGRMKEAKAALESARGAAEVPDVVVAGARIATAERDVAGATRAVDQVLAGDAANVEALLLKSDLERLQGRRDTGREYLEKAVSLAPGLKRARIALADAFTAEGRYDEARKQVAELRKAEGGAFVAQLLTAQLNLRERKFAAARDAIAPVLNAAPDYVPALLVSSGAELALGSYGHSETQARKALAQQPGSIVARRLLAAVLLKQGRSEEAAEAIRPVLESSHRDPLVYSLAGDIALQSSDVDRARKYYTQAAELAPKDATIRISLGVSELRSGQLDEGIAELQKATELDAGSYRADVMLIMTHLRARQWDKALQAVNALAKKQPDNPLTYNLAAAAHIGKRDYKAARESLDKALSVRPNYVPAVLNHVGLDLTEKKPDQAVKRLEAAIAKQPTNAQLLGALARVKATQGTPRDEIATILEKAQRENPDLLPPRLSLIRFYIEGKQPAKAVALASDTAVKFPRSREAVSALGHAQLANGETRQAVQTLQKMVAEHGKQAESHVELARAQMMDNDVEAARRSLRKAFDISPRSAAGLLAQLEFKAGRTGEALKVAQYLQKAEPKAAAGYLLEGDILMQDRKPAVAASAYRKALDLDKSTAAAVKLHAALGAGGNKAAADQFVASWLGERPGDVPFRLYLGDTKMAARDWTGARDQFEAVLEKAPGNVQALNNLAWTLRELKDPKARDYAQRAFDAQPGNAAVLDTLAMVLADAGDTGKALELHRKALSLAPRADLIRFNYAQVLVKAGRKDEAKKELEALVASGRKFPGQEQAKQLLSTL